MLIPDAPRPALEFAGIWSGAGLIGRGVMVTMLIMSLYATWVALDRHLRYRETRRQAARLLPELGRLLAAGRRDAALELVKRHPRCPQARVVHALLAESDWTSHEGDPDGAVAAAQRTLDQAIDDARHELQAGLGGLATVAASAPFVGLLGTVIGILHAFTTLGQLGSGGFGAVAGAIGEALVTTAAGLFIAIPAVWLHNGFNLKVENFSVEMRRTGVRLLDYVSRQSRV